MLDYLCEWIRQIAYYMVLVTVIMQLAAGQGYRKYIRLFTGIILVLLILTPVLRLFGVQGENTELLPQGGFEASVEQIEEKIREMEQDTIAEIQAGEILEENGADQIAGLGSDSRQDRETGQIEVEEIRIGR